jgi:hypothetical protein
MHRFGSHGLVMIALVLTVIARAQAAASGDGSPLAGVAVDASGASLPGVTVTIAAHGAAKADPLLAITDDTGRFNVDQLGPGTYSVVFSLAGFAEKRFDSVVVPVDEELRAVLEPAGVPRPLSSVPEARTRSFESVSANPRSSDAC